MKRILSGLIFLSTLSSFSQNLEIFGGLNKNRFFDIEGEGGYGSKYFIDYGYLLKFGISDIKIQQMRLRFTLGYEKYGGEFQAFKASPGSGIRTHALIDKSVVSMGFFPVCFRVIKRIDLNIGLEYSRLNNENFSGTYSGYGGLPFTTFSEDLKQKYEKFSANNHLGILVRIAYDINLSDKLILSPQYSFYYGLSHEFVEFPEETRSLRHQFCVGLQRKLKQ